MTPQVAVPNTTPPGVPTFRTEAAARPDSASSADFANPLQHGFPVTQHTVMPFAVIKAKMTIAKTFAKPPATGPPSTKMTGNADVG